jgi:lipopolysaccharide transport system ATP-binding protein
VTDTTIRIQDLGKRYRLGRREEQYETLRDAISSLAAAPFRKMRRIVAGEGRDNAQFFWALRGVSSEIHRGDVLGVIGRNGAGKSTLLKILSRITEPTEGFAAIHGTVASLLEVGSGFHGELTGRENVFLNGAILGMKNAEILRRFDEIVAFAEIEKFIDMPVKRYSSGMQLRLAFGVAAHLESDILIVDEALAVGDLEFQRKCLGKLQSARSSGRTVVFVSHDISAIKRLCTRCMLLENGRVLKDGPADSVVELYVNKYQPAHQTDSRGVHAEEDERFVLSVQEGRDRISMFSGEPLCLEFEIETPFPLPSAEAGIGVTITSNTGDPIVSMSSLVQRVLRSGVSRRWKTRCDLGRLPINAGTYFANVYIGNGERSEKFANAIRIEVLEHDVFGTGQSLPNSSHWGPMYWAPAWDIRAAESDEDSTEKVGAKEVLR